jgi:hypothetical protein
MNTEIAEIWKEYFDKLLNTEEPRELIKKGNQSVRYLFIDFQKAYVSIHRDTLWKCMKEFKFLLNKYV